MPVVLKASILKVQKIIYTAIFHQSPIKMMARLGGNQIRATLYFTVSGIAWMAISFMIRIPVIVL